MFLAYRSFELYLSGPAWWVVEFIKWIVCHLDQPLFHFVGIYTAVNQSDIRYEICFDIIKIVYATVKKNGVIFRVLLNQERAHVVIREILAEICDVQFVKQVRCHLPNGLWTGSLLFVVFLGVQEYCP